MDIILLKNVMSLVVIICIIFLIFVLCIYIIILVEYVINESSWYFFFEN